MTPKQKNGHVNNRTIDPALASISDSGRLSTYIVELRTLCARCGEGGDIRTACKSYSNLGQESGGVIMRMGEARRGAGVKNWVSKGTKAGEERGVMERQEHSNDNRKIERGGARAVWVCA